MTLNIPDKYSWEIFAKKYLSASNSYVYMPAYGEYSMEIFIINIP